VADEAYKHADANERDGEGDRGDEHAPARPIGDGCANEEPEPREFQGYQQRGDNQRRERQQDKSSGSGHILIETLRCGISDK